MVTKVNQYIVTTTLAPLEIIGARLATEAEIKNVPKEKLKFDRSWWISGDSALPKAALYLTQLGEGPFCGCLSLLIAVRPVLDIRLPKDGWLKVSDTFQWHGYDFEIISETAALCKSSLDITTFGPSPDYDKSDVKETIERWYKQWKY